MVDTKRQLIWRWARWSVPMTAALSLAHMLIERRVDVRYLLFGVVFASVMSTLFTLLRIGPPDAITRERRRRARDSAEAETPFREELKRMFRE